MWHWPSESFLAFHNGKNTKIYLKWFALFKRAVIWNYQFRKTHNISIFSCSLRVHSRYKRDPVAHRKQPCRCLEAHSVHRHEIMAHQREVTLSNFRWRVCSVSKQAFLTHAQGGIWGFMRKNSQMTQ